MNIAHEVITVRTRHTFTIARGGSSEWRVVWLRIRDEDGVEGWGEAAPSRYYGETVETVCAAMRELAPIVERHDLSHIEPIESEIARVMHHNGAARSAVSAALHDLLGKRLGAPVYRTWGLDPRTAPRSSFTIGIGDADELRRKVREASEYPILKVKLGTDRDEEIIRTVRELAPEKVIRIDANAAWTPKLALQRIEMLARHGVEFVEQPLPGADIEGMRFVRERSPLPIIADESCVVAADIPRLAGAVDGINIKLAKCGGLLEARAMIATARAHGMLVMLGCMIETSLGISAGAQLAPLLDHADLDGAALLADDPFAGVSIPAGTITFPSDPGLGVRRR